MIIWILYDSQKRGIARYRDWADGCSAAIFTVSYFQLATIEYSLETALRVCRYPEQNFLRKFLKSDKNFEYFFLGRIAFQSLSCRFKCLLHPALVAYHGELKA